MAREDTTVLCCRGRLLTTLDRANARRAAIAAERGALFSMIAKGKISLEYAMAHPAMRRMRAFTFLTRLPGIGSVAARRILSEVCVADDQRLSMIGRRQRDRIIELVGAAVGEGGARLR